ncbi:Phytanoyl-CoA dioxygenase (PhyH) [Pseudoruegeria aquimaris]|uniref:Phytanoyl-CoA dioxygenase (PhyH) n=1 Tax=Pseudoruegeria aquimaris TaxID=393663 RepID=A0A1Y5T6W5_9RHOB|nr:phytanoyl-CoA dioxygenase family protein [Pseudoruegeria aquimaris]SLN53889.1 Phytanoyl-CoA dioxygenase (PhyH) [Pseudoruegeria aquimaris]
MLSPDQISEFQATGILVVPDVLPETTRRAIEAEYTARLDGLLAGWGLPEAGQPLSFEEKLMAAHATGRDWFQPLDISLPAERIRADTPFHFGPAVFEMITHPRILDMVEDLIGPEITSNPIQHVRIKPPEARLAPGERRAHVGGTDWHQDRAVAHEEADDTQMITVWLAITDATVENGCLQAKPFKAPTMLPHCPQRQTAIAPGHLDTSDAIPLPVPAGGAVLFDPMVPHAALPNRSDGLRWSFDLRYNVTGQPTGRSHFPEFIARSRAHPEKELRDWRDWQQMWLAARARLAGESHIDIHRWQADSPACA